VELEAIAMLVQGADHAGHLQHGRQQPEVAEVWQGLHEFGKSALDVRIERLLPEYTPLALLFGYRAVYLIRRDLDLLDSTALITMRTSGY
jgi:hypothetical protein